ncbi:hypothetical protein AVEN_117948-1 [Araneus ventricosus]|uniref:Uncharacterized protein n=1 Tax=Araneus ventricosus TaxID=182803 RepID=A0A4Y2KST6_ARAVE|nr:hypothetical protein AVEN_117948-1 [Araneus ventricosus]
MGTAERLLHRDGQLTRITSSALLGYYQMHLPHIGFQNNWEELLTPLLEDYRASKSFMEKIWDNLKISQSPSEKLELNMKFVFKPLIRYLNETLERLGVIHAKMLEQMNPTTKMLLQHPSENLGETFFDWLKTNVKKMQRDIQKAYLMLVERISSGGGRNE